MTCRNLFEFFKWTIAHFCRFCYKIGGKFLIWSAGLVLPIVLSGGSRKDPTKKLEKLPFFYRIFRLERERKKDHQIGKFSKTPSPPLWNFGTFLGTWANRKKLQNLKHFRCFPPSPNGALDPPLIVRCITESHEMGKTKNYLHSKAN